MLHNPFLFARITQASCIDIFFFLYIVITIHERNPFILRMIQSHITGRTYSPNLLMEYSHAGILGGILIANGARGILAAIIYEKQFKVLIGLSQDTVYAAVQVHLGIINWNND